MDAWHTPFSNNAGIADVHVDVVFHSARLGGEEDSPIRFRLSLKRAELLVITGPTEPIDVVKTSVSRDQTVKSVFIEKTINSENSHSIGGAFGISSKFPLIGALNLSGSMGKRKSTTESSVIKDDLPLISIVQSKSHDNHYRWTLTPTHGVSLSGRPWDPENEPRLKIKDKRQKTNHVAGSARIEVRCKREDLHIEDIVIKDKRTSDRIAYTSAMRNKMAAVEAYLRNVLLSEGLCFSNLSDPFGDICLADVVVEEASA